MTQLKIGGGREKKWSKLEIISSPFTNKMYAPSLTSVKLASNISSAWPTGRFDMAFNAPNCCNAASSGSGGSGSEFTKKSMLDNDGDSDVIEATGESSLSAADCIAGRIVSRRMTSNCVVENK